MKNQQKYRKDEKNKVKQISKRKWRIERTRELVEIDYMREWH